MNFGGFVAQGVVAGGPSAHGRALRLRLRRMQRKIAKVEEEIAEAQGSSPPELGLFAQKHPTPSAFSGPAKSIEGGHSS